jgi:hypothetical protein
VTEAVEVRDSVATKLTGSVMPASDTGTGTDSERLAGTAPGFVAGMENEALPLRASDFDLLLDIVAGMLDASNTDMELLCDALAGT